MKETANKRFIVKNRQFFSQRVNGRRGGKKILVEAVSMDEYALLVTMKISAAVSEILGLEMVVLPAFRAHAGLFAIIASFLPTQILKPKWLMMKAFLRNLTALLKIWSCIRTGKDLADLTDSEVPVGIHIYDSLLRRQELATIEALSFVQKLYVVMEMTFYFAMRRLFETDEIGFVVLPDNTYREGLIFEILKKKAIPCLAGIDIYGISMHKYETIADYNDHCRTPDSKLIDRIRNTPQLYSQVESYLAFRFSGHEKQHDLMRAYAKDKICVDRDYLIQNYQLDPSKKIVLVMSHIFCDAPHAYPGMLFKDYHDWLIETCRQLSGNRHINFLVKEHPSVSLYNEDGLIDSILETHGYTQHLLSKNVNTKSLFNSIDVLVTCGGTAGMEFPCFGIPVIVAARPPYVDFGYIKACNTVDEYSQALDYVHLLDSLSDESMQMAKTVLYSIQALTKIHAQELGFGSQQNYNGCNFDFVKFYDDLIKDCSEPAGYEYLLKVTRLLLNGPYKNLQYDEH